MATNTTLQFRKVASMPTSGLQVGAIYFDKGTGTINIATSATAYDKFGYGVKNAEWKNQILTLTKSDGTSVTLNFSDVASKSAFDELKTAFEAEQGFIDTLQSEMSQAKTDISTNATNIGKNATAISEEAERADKAEKKIAEDLAKEISDRGTAEAAINSAANALKDRIDGHDSEIANLWNQVGETDAAGLRKKVADLEGTVGDSTEGLVKDVDTLETKVAALETNVGTSGDIGKRLAAVETLAGQNKTAIESNDSDIADHETRIQAVENAVKDGGTLEARVDSIETLIAASGDSDNVINKVSEVITWFEGVSEGKGGATLLSDVATLKETTVPAVSAQADKGVADAATAQSGVNAINEKLGNGFSKTSTVTSQLAAVKTTADNALPAATFTAFQATNTDAIAAAKKAGTDAQTTANQAVADAADAQTTANQGVADAAAALAKANEKVAAVTLSGDDYITVSNATGNSATDRKMSIALDVATNIANLTTDNKQVANAKAMKDYVDNKIVAAMVWEQFD